MVLGAKSAGTPWKRQQEVMSVYTWLFTYWWECDTTPQRFALTLKQIEPAPGSLFRWAEWCDACRLHQPNILRCLHCLQISWCNCFRLPCQRGFMLTSDVIAFWMNLITLQKCNFNGLIFNLVFNVFVLLNADIAGLRTEYNLHERACLWKQKCLCM